MVSDPSMSSRRGGKIMKAYSSYIATIGVTQSGADTATEDTVQTGLGINQPGVYLWQIYQIDWNLKNTVSDGNAGVSSSVSAQLTTKTNTSELMFDNDEVIDLFGWAMIAQGTVASLQAFPYRETHVFKTPIAVAVDTIFLRLRSAATAAAQQVACRIHYDVVKSNIEDFYRLVTVQR